MATYFGVPAFVANNTGPPVKFDVFDAFIEKWKTPKTPLQEFVERVCADDSTDDQINPTATSFGS